MVALEKKAPNQKELRSTPLARRSLRGRLLDLDIDPANWESPHLRGAYKMALISKLPETAKRLVVDVVEAADRAVKAARARDLASARRQALADLTKNCKGIANCTKPRRLNAAVRRSLDEAARSLFVEGPVDLESIQEFLSRARTIVEGWPQDQVAAAIFRHLVATKGDITHGEDLPLDARTPIIVAHCALQKVRLLCGRTPKIAADYEALDCELRLACEGALRQLVDAKQRRLTAHDIFSTLHVTLEARNSIEEPGDNPPIIDTYLEDAVQSWTRDGSTRGLYAGRNGYLSPFNEFAERILLDARDPASRIFDPITEDEKHHAWAAYHEIPADYSKADISAMPFAGIRVVTEYVLRSHLKRSSKKST
jgi:hypothetical protein